MEFLWLVIRGMAVPAILFFSMWRNLKSVSLSARVKSAIPYMQVVSAYSSFLSVFRMMQFCITLDGCTNYLLNCIYILYCKLELSIVLWFKLWLANKRFWLIWLIDLHYCITICCKFIDFKLTDGSTSDSYSTSIDPLEMWNRSREQNYSKWNLG